MTCFNSFINCCLIGYYIIHATKSDVIYGITPNFDLEHYNEYETIVQYLYEVANLNPDFVTLRFIGQTYERRQILGVKIGFPQNASEKRAVWVDGGNHGREWPAAHTTLLLINEIRQWRKNRAPSNCLGTVAYRERICCHGVDINRNYDFEFNQLNMRFNNSCSDEYQGPFPFSEPESRAVRDYFLGEELRDNVDLMLSLHTHGEMIILPYNHRKFIYPNDYYDLVRKSLTDNYVLAQKAAKKIHEDDGTEYRVGTAADMIGPATGGASDWIKNNTGVKYVYVIELPPDLYTSFAFQMKPHWLVPTFTELWRGFRVFFDEVANFRSIYS